MLPRWAFDRMKKCSCFDIACALALTIVQYHNPTCTSGWVMQAQAVQSGTDRNPPAINMHTPKTKQYTRAHFCVSQSRTICPTLTQFRLLSSAHPGVQAPSHAVHRRRQATRIPPLLACTAALRARHVLQRAEAARPAAPAAARDRQAGLLERGTVEAAGLHWCWCHALGRAPIVRCERLPQEAFSTRPGVMAAGGGGGEAKLLGGSIAGQAVAQAAQREAEGWLMSVQTSQRHSSASRFSHLQTRSAQAQM